MTRCLMRFFGGPSSSIVKQFFLFIIKMKPRKNICGCDFCASDEVYVEIKHLSPGFTEQERMRDADKGRQWCPDACAIL